MNDDVLFTQTIQYLDCLYSEGLLSPEKVARLARFALELSRSGEPARNSAQSAKSHSFSSTSSSDQILSDTRSRSWG